jgi:PEGA domain
VTEITFDPNGAEIFLDKKFVGSSPATVHITEGTHELILRFAHHIDRRFSMAILKDNTVTVKATLAPI